MPERKNTKNKNSRRNGVPERHLRKGVCMMCGAHTSVSHIEEFDNQLLCDNCCDDTTLLAKYLQSGEGPGSDLEEGLLDDDPLL